jgi:hypothetical protein
MDIETVIAGIIVLALVGVMYRYWPKGKGLDVNQDGKIDGADAKAAVEVVATKVEEEIKVEVAKIVEEAKVVEDKVEEVVKTEVKKVATRAKAAAKKAADVNEDGKVDVADVVEVVKKGRRPKKSA